MWAPARSADEVAAKHVKCTLMGTGAIGCASKETLSVKGVGSGKVYYIGKPVITKSKLSNVKIVQLEGGVETEATDVIEDNEPETEAAEGSETTDNGTGLLDLMEVPEPAVVNRE